MEKGEEKETEKTEEDVNLINSFLQPLKMSGGEAKEERKSSTMLLLTSHFGYLVFSYLLPEVFQKDEWVLH